MSNEGLLTGTSFRENRLRIKSKFKETIVRIITSLFILLFLYTGFNKSIEIYPTINTLNETPHLSLYATELAWLIVALEYMISILLFFFRSRVIGLYAATGLMFLFTLYIIYMKLEVPRLPCSCGGVIAQMSWDQHLIFNIFFTLLGILGIYLNMKNI